MTLCWHEVESGWRCWHHQAGSRGQLQGWSLLPVIILIYPQLCRGNIIVSGVLFIVSAGTTKERTTAFLCWVHLMVWRRQVVTGYEEAGRVL